ncbi:uncharacterized protein LOC134856634 [Symsagittifera roscoffensis]|uniref:uncharacterized protein LOC134856634 n=1 Tax=Symsagittifera roscoffensis TaxID=84072 RepID=UPI00307C622E
MTKLIRNLLLLLLNARVICSCTSRPSSFSVSGVNSSQATVSWNSIAGASTYDFSSSIDGSTLHSGLTQNSYVLDNLIGGTRYDITARVEAFCSGTASGPFSDVIIITTIPEIPTAEINMVDRGAINIVMRSEGPVDTFTIVNSVLPGGFHTSPENSQFISGLNRGSTYTFQIYSTLNGVNSEKLLLEHKVPEDKIAGINAWTFAAIIITIMFLLLILIIFLAVFVIFYKRNRHEKRNGDDSDSQDSLKISK